MITVRNRPYIENFANMRIPKAFLLPIKDYLNDRLMIYTATAIDNYKNLTSNMKKITAEDLKDKEKIKNKIFKGLSKRGMWGLGYREIYGDIDGLFTKYQFVTGKEYKDLMEEQEKNQVKLRKKRKKNKKNIVVLQQPVALPAPKKKARKNKKSKVKKVLKKIVKKAAKNVSQPPNPIVDSGGKNVYNLRKNVNISYNLRPRKKK